MGEIDCLKKNNIDYNEDFRKGKFLTFTLGRESYGIEIQHVTGIVDIQPITEAPGMPVHIKGTIDLKGRTIPVIDIRLRFRKEFKEYTNRTCIIMTYINDFSAGLIVDTVSEIVKIEEQNIVYLPGPKTDFQNNFIKGIGKTADNVVLLVDCEEVLNSTGVETFTEIKENAYHVKKETLNEPVFLRSSRFRWSKFRIGKIFGKY